MGENAPSPRLSVVVLPAGTVANGGSTTLRELDAGGCSGLHLLVRSHDVHPMVVEMVQFAPRYGSWLLVPAEGQGDPDVVEQGALTFVTMVDPLFCALGMLEAGREVDGRQVFQPLDSLLITADGTDFRRMCPADQIALLCDVKEVDVEKFYKFSDEKALAWILRKLTVLMSAAEVKEKDGVELIAQYLSAKWAKRLRATVLDASPTREGQKDSEHMTAKDVAMSVMMASAKENNEADRRHEKEKRVAAKAADSSSGASGAGSKKRRRATTSTASKIARIDVRNVKTMHSFLKKK